MEDERTDSDTDEEDEVVREMDVYVSNGTLPEGSKLFLLQCPLRPPWRPYDLEDADMVQMKPEAKKLQINVPLPLHGPNIDPEAEPTKRLTHLRLQSAPAALNTSFAVGTVRDGKLLLVPVEDALQLRPSMSHLDVLAKPAAGGRRVGGATDTDTLDEDEDVKPQLQAVNVQRRETEKQTEARLRSYSHYISQQEAEPWVPLNLHGADSEATANVWEQLTSAPETEIAMTMTRQQYLDAIVPGPGLPEGDATQSAGGSVGSAALGQPAEMMAGLTGRPQPQLNRVPDEAKQALPGLLMSLLDKHPIVTVPAIRRHFHAQEGPAAALAAKVDPVSLQQEIADMPNFVFIRGSILRRSVGDAKADPIRGIILGLLQDKECIRRNEVMDAAQVSGVKVSDSVYGRVMKELCTSKGALWSLRAPDSD